MGSEYLLHAGSASWGQVLGSHQEQCPAGSWDGLLGHSQPTVQVVPANNDTLLDAPLGSVFHGTTLSSGTLHRQDRFSYTSFSRMAHGHTSSTVCCPKPGQISRRCNLNLNRALDNQLLTSSTHRTATILAAAHSLTTASPQPPVPVLAGIPLLLYFGIDTRVFFRCTTHSCHSSCSSTAP